MTKLSIAFSMVFVLGAAQAWAGPACEGVFNPVRGTGACGPCDNPVAGEIPNDVKSCVVVLGTFGDYACAGGNPTTGRGCVGGKRGGGGELFACSTSFPGEVFLCTETECREAAEAACSE